MPKRQARHLPRYRRRMRWQHQARWHAGLRARVIIRGDVRRASITSPGLLQRAVGAGPVRLSYPGR